MYPEHTIDDQDVLASELKRHGVEFAANSLLAHGLTGHDEGAADVTVLDEALAVSDIQFVGSLQSGYTTRVRNLGITNVKSRQKWSKKPTHLKTTKLLTIDHFLQKKATILTGIMTSISWSGPIFSKTWSAKASPIARRHL